MGVDRSVVSEEVVPPDIRKKLVSGKGNVFILDQIEEKIVFFWRQLYFFAVHGYGTGGDIDFKPIEFHDFFYWFFDAAVSGKNCVDTSHQFFRTERFHDIVVNTQFKAKELVVFFTSGRKHYDRDILDFPNFLAQAGLQEAGERITQMLRAMTAISFQKNCGSANLRQEHDAICDWVFDKEPDFKAFEEGTTKLDRADMEKAKDLFYDIFGWDKTTGVPTRETLEKFDLGDMADDLEARGIYAQTPAEETAASEAAAQ